MKDVKDVQNVWFRSGNQGVEIFIQYETIVAGKGQIGTESRRVATHTGRKNYTEVAFRFSEAELVSEVVMWLSMFESQRRFQVFIAELEEEIFLLIGDVPSPMTIVEIVNKIRWATMSPSERFVRSHYGLMDLDTSLMEALRLRDEQLGGDGSFGSSTLIINDDYVMWSSASRGGHLLFKKMQGYEDVFGVDMGTTMELSKWTGKVVKVAGLASAIDREETAEFILSRLSHLDLSR